MRLRSEGHYLIWPTLVKWRGVHNYMRLYGNILRSIVKGMMRFKYAPFQFRAEDDDKILS